MVIGFSCLSAAVLMSAVQVVPGVDGRGVEVAAEVGRPVVAVELEAGSAGVKEVLLVGNPPWVGATNSPMPRKN